MNLRAVVAIYLGYVIIDGVYRSRSTGQLRGYFLANRSLPWWAVGLSIMATQMSAITLVGTTGQAYVDGMRFIQFYFGLPFAMIIICITVVPFFYGSVLGVFILAIGTEWATAKGAFFGLIFGMAAVASVAALTDISFLWYNVVGAAVVVTVGACFAFFEKEIPA